MTDQQVIARAKLNALQIAFRETVRSSMPAEDILAILAKELWDESIAYTGTKAKKMKTLAKRLAEAAQ